MGSLLRRIIKKLDAHTPDLQPPAKSSAIVNAAPVKAAPIDLVENHLESDLSPPKKPGRQASAEAFFNEGFQKLKTYKSQNGHCHPTRDECQAGDWASYQRKKYSRPNYPQAHRQALEKIGFIWDSQDAAWERSYLNVVKFFNATGHSDVPSRNDISGRWVKHQRQQAKLPGYKEDYRKKLDKLDFKWNLSTQNDDIKVEKSFQSAPSTPNDAVNNAPELAQEYADVDSSDDDLPSPGM